MVETKYDLEELLKHQEHIITDTEDCKRDADRCADAWEKLYIPYFLQSEFWKDCDYSKAARKGFFEFEDCSISGDVVFNFGKDKKFKRNQKEKILYTKGFSKSNILGSSKNFKIGTR